MQIENLEIQDIEISLNYRQLSSSRTITKIGPWSIKPKLKKQINIDRLNKSLQTDAKSPKNVRLNTETDCRMIKNINESSRYVQINTQNCLNKIQDKAQFINNRQQKIRHSFKASYNNNYSLNRKYPYSVLKKINNNEVSPYRHRSQKSSNSIMSQRIIPVFREFNFIRKFKPKKSSCSDRLRINSIKLMPIGTHTIQN